MDTLTTVLGVISAIASVLYQQGIQTTWTGAVSAVSLAALGYFTNKGGIKISAIDNITDKSNLN